MDSKILEEKMELLRWIINLNDEQVIKNLINFKNEIFGVPFAEPTVCSTVVKSGSRGFGEIVLSEDYLMTINQSIKDLSQRNVFTADDEASNALLEVGENAGYSRGVIEKYIEKLEVDIDYEKTERARKMWGDGWDTLSPKDQDVLKDVCTNRMNATESLVKKKLNGIKTIVEFKNRYDNGIFDSTYSLDDILKLKMEKAASPKLYSGISNSSSLLRADEFISDQAVVQYIKDLCPNNSNISNCNNLQEIANELASHPVEVELVHFQNAAKDANNIYFHKQNFEISKFRQQSF